LSESGARGLLKEIKMSPGQSAQLLALLTLPCWRHTVRIDQSGGISLYIERDWDDRLLDAVCRWFGVSGHAVDITRKFTGEFGGVVAGIGVHWRRSAKTRVRFYTVFGKETFQPEDGMKLFLKRICEPFGCSAPSGTVNLLLKRRRALLINIEDKNHQPVIKLEIPDVQWPEIAEAAMPEKSKALRMLRSAPPPRLCYLGVRLSDSKKRPETTCYLPYAYPARRGRN
jgi:hypothetical protein